MAVFTFDPGAFRAAYPGFATLSDEQLNQAFGLATLYLRNTDDSPVSDVTRRGVLLYLLTAHICRLMFGENGQAPSGMTGRIASATQGSVSVSMETLPQRPGMAWYYSTTYGAMFWEATASYRTARYVRGFPTRNY